MRSYLACQRFFRVAFHYFVVQSNNDFHLFVLREKGYCETPAVLLELRDECLKTAAFAL